MKALVSALLSSVLGYAQIAGSAGTIQGTILDGTGAAIPGARVSATNSGTAARRNTQTDSSGQFTMPGLSIGSWTLTVEASGFASKTTEPMQLTIGQVLIQRMRLDPAGVSETLNVRETPDAIDVMVKENI